MSNQPPDPSAADRLGTQIRCRMLEPMEQADAERAAYYAKFDRAVATLEGAKADRVNLHSSFLQEDGLWVLRDAVGQLVAKVLDPDQPKPAAKPKTPAPAAKPIISQREKKLLFAYMEKVNRLDETVATVIEKVVGRIKKLEDRSAIDAESFLELERIAERVDAIETRGFRFVGKYQAPGNYTKGDVVAYKGALWNCVQDAKVGERPNTASHKWTLMISGGEQ